MSRMISDFSHLLKTGFRFGDSDVQRACRNFYAMKERLQLILDSAGVGTFDWKLDTGQVTWNGHHARLMGFEPTRQITTLDDFNQRVHPEDKAELFKAVYRALSEKTEYVHEFRVVHPDGSIHWLLGRGRGQYDAAGNPEAMMGTIIDITDQKLFELRIQEKEERLARAAEAANVGIWDWEISTGRLIWSDQQQRLWGYGPGEYAERVETFFERMHPDDRARVWSNVMKALKEKCTYEGDYRVVRPTGEVVWIRARGRGIYDESGKAVMMSGTCLDITKQKLAEIALRESEHQFRTMADSLPQLAWVADQAGRIVWFNQRWYAFTGTKPAEMMGYGWEKAHHPDHVRRILDGLKRASLAGVPWEDIHPLRSASGDWRWFLSRALPVRDERGEVVRWLGTCTDINSQKQLEDHLRKAKEEADAASQMKSAFLANMSHEIRTPLGVILGFTELLQDPGLTPDDRFDFFQTIRKNGEQLSGIINDILDLSKIESGQMKIESREFDLCEVISDIRSVFKEKAEQKRLALNVEIEPSVPRKIISDSFRLTQIINNVLGNAIKFTQSGGITVHITAALEARGKARVVIEIADTGIGLTEEQVARLFKPFMQADVSTTRKFGGTGLGLALSKRIANALNGDIALLRSEPGGGSTFQIWILCDLPSVRSAAIPSRSAAPESALPPTGTDEPALDGVKVLLVEDSPDNQRLTSRILTKEGAAVEIASNGEEGISKALASNFDVVLMDIQMPVLDGYEATSRLRGLGYRKPIIALTAHALREMRDKSYQAGCTDHISKPVNKIELIAKVYEYSHPS